MQSIASAHAFLTAARHLIEQATQTAREHIGEDLEPALAAVDREIEVLAGLVSNEENAKLAERLGPGFAYIPD
jgi:hypothetical protein